MSSCAFGNKYQQMTNFDISMRSVSSMRDQNVKAQMSKVSAMSLVVVLSRNFISL